MIRVYTRPLAGTWSASSNVSGYPPAHLAMASLERPWRPSTGGSEWVEIDLGALREVAAVLVYGSDALWTLTYGASSPPGTSLGDLAAHYDPHQRGRALWAVDGEDFITARYLRLTSASAAEIGAVYVFEGWSEAMRPTEVRISDDAGEGREALPNGAEVVWQRAIRRARLALGFAALGSQAPEGWAAEARTQAAAVDLRLPESPWAIYPVVALDAEIARDRVRLRRENLRIDLLELA